MVALATALFSAAFALRLAVEESDVEVLLLCALPIAILAAEFGLLGGLLGAGVAAVLLALYVVLFDPEIGAWRYAGRVAVFAALAVLVAALAEALRRLALTHEHLERESAAKADAERQSAELTRLAEERRRLAEEVITAEEQARRRIAEDLHDGALQTLLSAKQDLIEASPGRAGVIRATEVVGEGIDGLRRAVSALHPVTIEHDGLGGAIASVATEAERRGGFRCELRVEEGASGPHDQVLLALTRELLANAAKHSGAGQVLVSISRDRDRDCLRLEVTDDGCGFDAAERLASPCDGHIGLACAERRARALGGSLTIAEGPERGTAVSVRIPAESGPDPALAAAAASGTNGRP
ncbi:MAG TPA: ATP-binding protein [Polyangia bacterium]|nr:ATP-binding protein [Polyangia bacterium]